MNNLLLALNYFGVNLFFRATNPHHSLAVARERFNGGGVTVDHVLSNKAPVCQRPESWRHGLEIDPQNLRDPVGGNRPVFPYASYD